MVKTNAVKPTQRRGLPIPWSPMRLQPPTPNPWGIEGLESIGEISQPHDAIVDDPLSRCLVRLWTGSGYPREPCAASGLLPTRCPLSGRPCQAKGRGHENGRGSLHDGARIPEDGSCHL